MTNSGAGNIELACYCLEGEGGTCKKIRYYVWIQKDITYRLNVKDITYHIITSTKVWLNK